MGGSVLSTWADRAGRLRVDIGGMSRYAEALSTDFDDRLCHLHVLLRWSTDDSVLTNEPSVLDFRRGSVLRVPRLRRAFFDGPIASANKDPWNQSWNPNGPFGRMCRGTTTNRLLAALLDEDFRRVVPFLQTVPMDVNRCSPCSGPLPRTATARAREDVLATSRGSRVAAVGATRGLSPIRVRHCLIAARQR
jgi:hypothetical protein